MPDLKTASPINDARCIDVVFNVIEACLSDDDPSTDDIQTIGNKLDFGSELFKERLEEFKKCFTKIEKPPTDYCQVSLAGGAASGAQDESST